MVDPKSLGRIEERLQNVFDNQSALGQSCDNHDVQFCCMMRLFVSRMNQVADLINTLELAKGDQPLRVEPISYDEVNDTFRVFTKIRGLPKFKENLQAWLMGEDMTKVDLGWPEDGGGAPEAEDEYPEGAAIFGGDYGKSQDGNGDRAKPDHDGEEADQVPEVPSADEGVDQPEDGPDGAEVPEVRDSP